MTDNTDDLAVSLESLVRGNRTRFAAYMKPLGEQRKLPGTCTTILAYSIARNSQRQARCKDLAKFVATRVVDFCIPRHRIQQAKEADSACDGTDHVMALAQEAYSLFVKEPNSGEGGELLLATLGEFILGYPQLFTKMDLKTNAQVHVHGADGIHATVSEDGGLALCWGESKLYKAQDAGVKACIDSIGPFLKDDGGTFDRKARDLCLLRDGLNLNDESLVLALKRFLDPDDEKHLQLLHRGLCLVGFDTTAYLEMVEQDDDALENTLKPILENVVEKLADCVGQAVLQKYHLDVFLIPFPNVQEFRDAFRAELRL